MKTGICYIVGAGDNSGTHFCPEKQDLVIAADGGYKALKANGIRVDLLLGDLDSLEKVPDGIPTVVHPTHKDETDLLLACREGMKRGFTEFRLYGCLGGKRISHTVANLQLLRQLADWGVTGTLYGNGCSVTLLRERTVRFPKTQSGFFSLFAVGGNALVSERNTLYELTDETLTPSYPLGVSNEFCGKEAEITVSKGDVLLILEDKP